MKILIVLVFFVIFFIIWFWICFLGGAKKWSDGIIKLYVKIGKNVDQNEILYRPEVIKVISTLMLVGTAVGLYGIIFSFFGNR